MAKTRRRAKPQPKRAATKAKVVIPKAVTVIVEKGEPDPIVVPRAVSVRAGGTVTFRSRVGRLTVFVPTPPRAKHLFPRTRGPVFGVPAKGKKLTVSVGKGKGSREYVYAVYCHKGKTFAKASFPKIIIYDSF